MMAMAANEGTGTTNFLQLEAAGSRVASSFRVNKMKTLGREKRSIKHIRTNYEQ